MSTREYHDPATGLMVYTSSTRRTTNAVRARFAGPGVASDVHLGELRAVIAAAADLPDDAVVSVLAGGFRGAPDALDIEYTADEPMPGDNPPADDHPTDVYDPADGWDRAYEREVDRANGVI